MSDWWSYLAVFNPLDPENFEVGLIILATIWFIVSCVRRLVSARVRACVCACACVRALVCVCVCVCVCMFERVRWAGQGAAQRFEQLDGARHLTVAALSATDRVLLRGCRCLLEFLAFMFDKDYDKQELVGEQPGNPFEDKNAAAKAVALAAGSDAHASAGQHAPSETKKEK